ncbi:hypothetical protein F6V25_07945 [Oryzomonas japonica]|uniref:Bbp19-like phage domain-containing protein n=1 Tax=Oryzomonas japonica TaxID=2603858 RepID=A0A7J4ZRQ4_9BACT|nr:hypothetical protein [Oryzomonas japonica]KAB0665645.1 hypothetical protein F6V25_07945 [Oryzomonas japonica]
MTKRRDGLPDAVYNRVFQQDRDGAAILEELSSKYHDCASYVVGDPHATSFNEGARSVILYLFKRAGSSE